MSTQTDVLSGDASATLGGIAVGSPAIKRALVFSLWDGITATVMVALTETFGIAAAVALKAPPMAIALLGSVPLLLGSLGQYFLPAVADVHASRKRYVLWGVGSQATLLFVTGLTGFLPRSLAAWAYVGAIVMAGVIANIPAACWTSWMGDLVAQEIRGRHFAWRIRVCAIVQLVCALTVGLCAANYTSSNAPWLFFTAIFTCAALFRFVSFQMLKRQYEPKSQATKTEGWRARPTPEFRRFALATGFVQAASAMSGPFFTVWFLRDLHFNYLKLAMAGCFSLLGSILSLTSWGWLADRYGNSRVQRIGGLLVCLVPVPYCFFSHHTAVWAMNFFGGICWAGFNLASFNQLLNVSENQNRTSLIAFASSVTGVMVFALTLLGGLLSTRLPTLFAWQLQSLFFLSAAMRLVAVAMLPSFVEVRVDRASTDLFNEIPGYRVGLGILRNVYRAFRGVD
jgi:MFS family permease